MSSVSIALKYTRGEKFETIRINTINYYLLRKSMPWFYFKPTHKCITKHPPFVQDAFRHSKFNYKKGTIRIELDTVSKRADYIKEDRFCFRNFFLLVEDTIPVKSTSSIQKLSQLTFDPLKKEPSTLITDFELLATSLKLDEVSKILELRRFFRPNDKLSIINITKYDDLKTQFLTKYSDYRRNLVTERDAYTISMAGSLSIYLDKKYELINKTFVTSRDTKIESLVFSLPKDFLDKVDMNYIKTKKLSYLDVKQYLLLLEKTSNHNFNFVNNRNNNSNNSNNDNLIEMQDAEESRETSYNYNVIAENHNLIREDVPSLFIFDNVNDYM